MSTANDLDRLLQGFVDRGLPGCSLHIARKGELLYEGYFGWADIENQIPLSETHLFPPGVSHQRLPCTLQP